MQSFRRLRVTLSALAVLTCCGLVLPAAPQAAAEPMPGTAEPIGGPLLTGAGLVVHTGPGVGPPPVVPVTAYVVADLTTGEILAAKAPHLQLPPASTLKILTAHTLLPKVDPKAVHLGTRADEDVDGTRVGMIAGQRYRVPDLWRGLLLASGNDAANALATMAGGVPETLRLMQEEARRLQANDTVATTPSGLDSDTAPGPYSSAYDLALITRAAYGNRQFAAYVSTRTAKFPGKGTAAYQIQNQNQLLWRYPGAIGVKTGFTRKARNTLVGAATRNGHTLVVTLLQGKHGIHRDAIKLLDWGFAADGKVEPVGQLVDPLPPGAASLATSGAGSVAGTGQHSLRAGRHAASRTLLAGTGLALLLGCVAGLRLRRRRRRGAAPAGGQAAGWG